MKRDDAEARCEELELAIRQLVEAWDAMPSGRSGAADGSAALADG